MVLVKDEWNTAEIIDQHILNNRPLIGGDAAFTGKGFVSKHSPERNYNVTVYLQYIAIS